MTAPRLWQCETSSLLTVIARRPKVPSVTQRYGDPTEREPRRRLSLTVTEKRLTADPRFDIPQPLTFGPSDSPEFEVGDAASGPQTYNASAGAGVRSPPGRSLPPVRP